MTASFTSFDGYQGVLAKLHIFSQAYRTAINSDKDCPLEVSPSLPARASRLLGWYLNSILEMENPSPFACQLLWPEPS